MTLSLQGCMAAGKTTAARYVQAHAPWLTVCLEDSAAPLAEVHRRGLDKTRYEDYLEIQRIWIAAEIERYRRVQAAPCALMDLGAEEIEFYTLHYPLSIGQDWPVAETLRPELTALRACMPRRILFLDAAEETLRRHKATDTARARGFFEHSLTHLLPLKRRWFLGRADVDSLRVDGLGPDELGEAVLAWAGRWASQGRQGP